MFVALPASAHSVGQVQTAKRISAQTVSLLDPQGNPVPGGMGTDTVAKVGDILTYIIQFTAVPNSASRGGGGYITDYIPANTEVVGARIIDANGNTLPPKRGGQYHDGYGPKDRHDELDAQGLLQGSMSAHYAETGIFFSTDPRTLRTPDTDFITVFNGILQNPNCTGADGLLTLLNAGTDAYAHNTWDHIQLHAFGIKVGTVQDDGRGSVPFLYGSALAGPDTHYPYEKVANPACQDGIDNDNDGPSDYPADPGCASALDDDETAATDGPVGPWQRIRYAGSETATGGATDCDNCANPEYVRVGVPTDLGFNLTPDTPLPAGTNAVRFGVGELIQGEEYLAEISLRVLALPLDPTMAGDINCSEVFGGDAAMPQNGQDNTWRYFVPAPACVALNLVFELSVDKLIALPGDVVTYTLRGKNLSVNPQNAIVVSDTFVQGDVSFLQMVQGPMPAGTGGPTMTWPTIAVMQPGDEFTYIWEMTVGGGNESTVNRANYQSTELAAPGFSVQAQTSIEAVTVLSQDVVVVPDSTTANSNVRYTATITNNGTGDADVNGSSFVRFKLPAGFSFCTGCASPQVNGNNVGDPTTDAQNRVTFTNGLQLIAPNGGTMVVDFEVTVGAVAAGEYTLDVQTQLDDLGVGKDVEISAFRVAPLLVDSVRTAAPVLDAPVIEGATTVTGTAPAGATVTIFVNGNSVPTVVAVGGVFSAVVPTLYGGQHLNGSAQSAGEIESFRSKPDVIVDGGVLNAACNDGIDNDGDNLIDLADPGCVDASDADETDVPQCSDGIDNDNNGDTDFPDDSSCSSYLDDSEDGDGPACNDGVDNDGDTLVDLADPGCLDANDINEDDIAACANGLDDDGDGNIDYPNDPGCDDVYDDIEDDNGMGTGGGGGMSAGAGGMTGVGGGAIPQGDPPDLGGVTDLDGGGSDADSGCGCRTVGKQPPTTPVWLLLAVFLGMGMRRRGRR